MIALRLRQAAEWLEGELTGNDALIQGVGIDSRRIDPGELFVALPGPRFDGHDFAALACERGACGVLVSRPVAALPQIRVADTRRALGQLGAAWRARFAGPLIALTGSNGKTTVKEMLAAILRVKGPVLATQGNLNNDIGVPLTLTRLGAQAYAVIEMGANHPGEIAYLTRLARPDVALVNNAGPAHLEGFGDLDGVARAKGEIYQGLPADGIAVINRDDPYADYWRALVEGRRIIDFALERPADVSGRVLADGRLLIQAQGESGEVALQLPGRHNLCNALAAAAAAVAVGADLEAIRRGLEGVQGVTGRLTRRPGPHGCTVLDDTYNANPASLAAGLEALDGHGPKWLVLGDMGELGAAAAALHAQAGAQARAGGVQRLFALGEHTRRAVQAFGPGGVHFADAQALAQALREALAGAAAPPILLIKGSRSMRMERIVQALAAEQDAP